MSDGVPIRIDQHEPAPGPRRPAILLLHGSGGNVSFWFDRIAAQLARLQLGVYAVRYFDRTGTVRATREVILDGIHFPAWQRAAADALGYLRSRPTVDPERIVLVGVSLGAFLSLALATEKDARVRAIVEISGGIPEQFIPAIGPEFPPTLIVHGDTDSIVPVGMAHQLEKVLIARGVRHETVILPGQDHWFDSGAQLQILLRTAAFLADVL